jgi:hypothetical protein
MPDDQPIKITRSAGGVWPTRFGPLPPGVISEPDNNEVAASVKAAASSVNMAIVNAAMHNDVSDSVLENLGNQPIKITRSAGGTWPIRFGPTPPGVISEPDNNEVAASVKAAASSVNVAIHNDGFNSVLENLANVAILNVQTGDVLRYANNKWRNYNETQLTDGGNF